MKTVADARLRAEARAFAFRFACDDCVHFNPARETCGLGYPAAPRQRDLEGATATDAAARTIEFCKEFDLGGSFSES